MSIEFYVTHKKGDCPECGRPFVDKHFGVSSHGWYFLLSIYPDEGINSWADWEIYLDDENIVIKDELGNIMDMDDMKSFMFNRKFHKPWPDRQLILNHAVQGIRNLAYPIGSEVMEDKPVFYFER